MIRGRALANLRSRALKGRGGKEALSESDFRSQTRAGLSSLLWDLSHALGVITGIIVLAVVLVFAFGRSWHLEETFDAIIPDRWFRSLAESKASERVEELRQKAAEELRKNEAASRASAAERKTFGLGSTKDQVRVVQGRPDRATDTTWRYGASEVYFVQDRVVGWRVAPSSPLKLR